MPAVTLFRDRGVPAADTPWQDIPMGSDAITKTQCGPYADMFPAGGVTVAGDDQTTFMPPQPRDLIRLVSPTDQRPFGHRHFGIEGAHLAINRDDI